MSTMATPFERVVKMEKPNSDLILAGEDGVHPVNDIPDADWLSKLVTEHRTITNIILSGKPNGRTACRFSQNDQSGVASTAIPQTR
jgi:hypothetical protein